MLPVVRRSLPALLLVLLLVLAGCGDSEATGGASGDDAATTSEAGSAGPTTTVAPVVREILAEQVDPPGAPGRTLTLARYTIAPGAELAPHVHPGVQLAQIESGELTYTVVSGTATVQRAGVDGTEQVTGPTTITLGPGDSVAELGDMVHFGANETSDPVVIVASLLTDSTQDLAVTVDEPD